MTASPAPTRRPEWSPEFLKSMRQEGDPEADAVADAILLQGGPALVNRAWRLMLSREEIRSDIELAKCPELVEYLAKRPFLPDDSPFFQPGGVDRARLLNGQRFFATWGPLIALALVTHSLPSSYAAANGVRVIAFTGRLETDPRRRILETAQILMDALEPHGLDPENPQARGFATVRNVRLMHAYIRRLLESGYWAEHGRHVSGPRRLRHPFFRRQDAQWQTKLWGRPINQEDMAGTLMAFGYLPIVSLRKGPDPAWVDDGVEDFVYAWSVIGALLGIDDRLLPASEDEAGELYALISSTQHVPSPEGRAITRALVQEIEMRVPGRLFDPFVRAVIRDQLDAHTACCIGITSQRWRVALLRGFRWVLIRLRLQQAVLTSFSDQWGYDIVGWMLGGKSKYHKNQFTLPESLCNAWGIADHPHPHRWRTRKPFSAGCMMAGHADERRAQVAAMDAGRA